MNIKKPLLVAGAATTIGLAGITGLGVASAATNETDSGGLIDKIATTFNLDKEEVKAVFEAEREEHEAEKQQRVEERLSELVSKGKLTEDQKSAILAKRVELKQVMETERESYTEGEKPDREAMKEKMQQHREELETWAEENDIPTQYLHFVMGSHHKHGPGGVGGNIDLETEVYAEQS